MHILAKVIPKEPIPSPQPVAVAIDVARGFATRIKCYSLSRSLVCSLLCTTLMAGILDGRAALAAFGQTPTVALRVPELDAGFHLLYELKFEEARNHFEAWQKSHPADPLGSASEAAAYLFEECYQQGVLTSEFFLDNKRFLGKIPLKTGTARSILRRGRTGAELGAVAIEDRPRR